MSVLPSEIEANLATLLERCRLAGYTSVRVIDAGIFGLEVHLCQLSGWLGEPDKRTRRDEGGRFRQRKDQPRLTPAQVLAVIVLGEARGALEEQIHAATPLEWRPHIEAVHKARRVIENGRFPGEEPTEP